VLIITEEELNAGLDHVTFSLVGPDGQEVTDIRHPLSVEWRSLNLQLLSPARASVTTGEALIVSGLTSPQARVDVGGQTLYSSASGYFEGLIKLPKQLGELELPLQVQKVGHHKLKSVVKVKRVSKRRWRRRERSLKRSLRRHRAGYRRARYPELSTRPSALQKVRLKGEVALIDGRGAEGEAQHVLLFTCAPASCPVWVRFNALGWVKRGDQIELLGRVIEPISREARGGGDLLTAPSVSADYVAPR
jgi:hypothetical protein